MTVNDFAPNLIWASPAASPNGQMGLRAMVAADLPAGVGTGTVTSVGLTAPAIFNVTGSPVTTAGSLNLALANQSANQVWAGPASGGAAAPGFRALVASDIPSLSGTYLVNANNLSDVASASTSRANLGLGSMATQNASAVAITGGTASLTTCNVTGSYDIGGVSFLGFGGGSNISNVSLGVGALAANTTGTINVAIGIDALTDNTTGAYNTAIGSNSLADNVSGNFNVALGTQALQVNTGSSNIAIGAGALGGNTSGIGNTGIGLNSGNNITTAYECVMIGYQIQAISATTNSQTNVNNHLLAGPYTLSQLPSASSVPYCRSFIIDSTVVASGNFGAVASGGGSIVAPVYSDGASWRIG